MKYFALLSSLFFLQLNAQAEVELVRMRDGGVQICENEDDLWDSRFGTYDLTLSQVESNATSLKVWLSLDFKQCRKKGESFAFEAISPYEVLSFRSDINSERPTQVSVTPLNVTLGAFLQDAQGFLSLPSPQITAKLHQTLLFDFTGETLKRFQKSYFQLTLQKKVRVENDRGQSHEDFLSFGSYSLKSAL